MNNRLLGLPCRVPSCSNEPLPTQGVCPPHPAPTASVQEHGCVFPCLTLRAPKVSQEGRKEGRGGWEGEETGRREAGQRLRATFLDVLAIEAGMTSSQLTELQLCLHHPQILILRGDRVPPKLPGFNTAGKDLLFPCHGVLLLTSKWLGSGYWCLRVLTDANSSRGFPHLTNGHS